MGIKKLLTLSSQLIDKKDSLINLTDKYTNFLLIKESEPNHLTAELYEPVICLILQGAKKVTSGDNTIVIHAGEYLVVSHYLPVTSQIIQATADEPYTALILRLDINILRGLHEEMSEIVQTMKKSNSLEKSTLTPRLGDAFYRLMLSSQNDLEQSILFDAILKEIHFRLLLEPIGGMLRSLLLVDSHASRIAKSLHIIRKSFNKALNMPQLASAVGMSISSFHHHFKSIVHITPLQYQKNLRLIEARKMICFAGESVTATALKVGYESPNQFSRDYTRKFSVNPSIDAKKHITNITS